MYFYIVGSVLQWTVTKLCKQMLIDNNVCNIVQSTTHYLDHLSLSSMLRWLVTPELGHQIYLEICFHLLVQLLGQCGEGLLPLGLLHFSLYWK